MSSPQKRPEQLLYRSEIVVLPGDNKEAEALLDRVLNSGGRVVSVAALSPCCVVVVKGV